MSQEKTDSTFCVIIKLNNLQKTTLINMFRQITALNITTYFNKGFSLFIVIIF